MRAGRNRPKGEVAQTSGRENGCGREGAATALDSSPAAVIIHVSDPHFVPDLLESLTQRPDVIAERVGEHEISVSLLGSRRAPWNTMELALRLRAWQAGRADVAVEIRTS